MYKETEEDGEGVDASSLLSCPVEGCIPTYQKHHNLERHLLFGKCKLVPEKYTASDTAKLAYAARVQEGFTTQPTPAAPTTTLHNLPWCKAGLLKVRGRQPVLTRISVSTFITSSRLDKRVAIKPTLSSRRCHETCAMLEGTTVSGAFTWKSS